MSEEVPAEADDGVAARRAKRARELIEEVRQRRAQQEPQEATPGFGDQFLMEMAEFAGLRATVNRMELGEP